MGPNWCWRIKICCSKRMNWPPSSYGTALVSCSSRPPYSICWRSLFRRCSGACVKCTSAESGYLFRRCERLGRQQVRDALYMYTDRRKQRCLQRIIRWSNWIRMPGRYRSAMHSAVRHCMCWVRGISCSRLEYQGSCASVEKGWQPGIGGGRS
ncbi:hypothetical protein D3C71_1756240 [compost metagenome]